MKSISEIMKAAHAMTRETIKEFPGADYAVTFSAALRIAWSQRLDALEELNACSGEKIYSILTACAWSVKKRAEARGYFFAEWITSPDDARTVAAEAYLTIYDDAEKAAAEGMPLQAAAYRAAWKAAKRIDNAERRNAADSIEETADDDSSRPQITPTEAAPGPAETVEALDAITSAARDDTDRAIIALLAAGVSRAEAAHALNISRQAIEKRLVKLRARMQ